MPKDYSKRGNIKKYLNFPWEQNKSPDFVLIDGRFRVACFLYSLINAKINSLIIFDDYNNRPYYHIVEEIVPIYKICGRQALFKVPKFFNKKSAQKLLDNFTYVFD